MNHNKPITRRELKEEFATKDDLKREINGVKYDIVGLEIRIQAQFEAQTEYLTEHITEHIMEKVDCKLDTHHKDIMSKLDFLVEQARGDSHDYLATQVGDHEQRISKLEARP